MTKSSSINWAEGTIMKNKPERGNRDDGEGKITGVYYTTSLRRHFAEE